MRTVEEAARLEALRSLRVLDTGNDSVFDQIVQRAAHVAQAPIALVSLIDEDRQWFKARVGLDGITETPREHAFCSRAIEAELPLVVPDALQDPRFVDNPFVVGEPYVRYYAGVPLVTDAGYRMGTLCVLDRTPRELAPNQWRALLSLARQAELQLSLLSRQHFLDAVPADAPPSTRVLRCDPQGRLVGDFRRVLGTGEVTWKEFEEAVHRDDRAMLTLALSDPSLVSEPILVRFARTPEPSRWLEVGTDAAGPFVAVARIGEISASDFGQGEDFEWVTLLSGEGTVLHESYEVNAVLGHPPQRWLGGSFLDRVHAPDVESVRAALSGATAQRSVAYRVPDSEGRIRTLASRIERLGGAQSGWLLRSHDLDVKETQREAELQHRANLSALARSRGALIDDLVRTSSHQRELTSFIVHDLKSPLSAIAANAAFLGSGDVPSEEVREVASETELAVGDLHRMVLDLLDVICAEDGKMVLKLDEVDLGAIARRAVERSLPNARMTGTAISGPVPGVVASLRGDRSVVGRVVENLIDNALKFARSAVTVDVAATHEEVILRVEDDGPGIPDADRRRIFEKYGRVQGTHARGSRGLGLYFCRLATELHGGCVELVEKAQGSSFVVRFPALTT